jgi:hypothetical protein
MTLELPKAVVAEVDLAEVAAQAADLVRQSHKPRSTIEN